MKQTITYDPNIDFIFFNYSVANAEEMKKKQAEHLEESNETGNKAVEKCNEIHYKTASEYYKGLSFIQKNVLDLFFHNSMLLTDYLQHLSFSEIDLEDATLDDLRQFIVEVMELDTLPTTYEETLEEVKAHYDSPKNFENFEKTTSLIVDMMKDPTIFEESFKHAVKILKQKFFEEKVPEAEKKVQDKINEHHKILHKDPDKFIQNLTKGKWNPTDFKVSELRIYITTFSPFTLYLSLKHKKLIYSADLDCLVTSREDTDLYLATMKFLSDPKRYKMIQMLSKKKWYANELAKEFSITPATMSYHVNKLYSLGLIHFEQGEQNKLYLELDKDRLSSLLTQIHHDLLK